MIGFFIFIRFFIGIILFIFESIEQFGGYWKSTYSRITCYTSANLETQID